MIRRSAWSATPCGRTTIRASPDRQRRTGVPPQGHRPVRPRRLRPAGLADPRQHDGQPPARVVPVHERGVRRRPRSPGAGRHVRHVQLLPPAVARRQLGWMLQTAFGRRRSSRATDLHDRSGQPSSRAGVSLVGGRPPGADGRWARRPPDAACPPPTTGRSSTSAARALPAHYLVALAVILAVRAAAVVLGRAGRARIRSPLQPPLLRPRHRVPAARDAEPRHVRPAVRVDVAGERPRVLRDPRQRPAGARASARFSLRQDRGMLYAALFVAIGVACCIPPAAS